MTDAQRMAIAILAGLSIAQSIAILVLLVMIASCDVYHEPQLHEVTPICEIAIDHVHGTSETRGDCDAGEW